MRFPPLLAVALALAACGSPAYYLLPTPQPGPSRAAPVASIVVAELSLPAYADALEVATLTGPRHPRAAEGARSGPTPRAGR